MAASTAPPAPFAHGLSLHVTITIAPSNVPKFLSAFKPVFDKVSAEKECTFFEVYLNPQEPGKVSWVENWNATPEWLMTVQLAKEYYKEYFAITEPMFVEPREYKVLGRVGDGFSVNKQG